jgi:Uri superfamily endonuclease
MFKAGLVILNLKPDSTVMFSPFLDHSPTTARGVIALRIKFGKKTMKSQPGSYALILQSHSTASVQIGRLRQIDIHPGYYICVGSAFGPGGVRARVLRHCCMNKNKHWHIDYLREFAAPLAVWISYETEKLEHRWAQIFYKASEMTPIQGFGSSDCKCYSHLFHTVAMPEVAWLSKIGPFYCAFERLYNRGSWI